MHDAVHKVKTKYVIVVYILFKEYMYFSDYLVFTSILVLIHYIFVGVDLVD